VTTAFASQRKILINSSRLSVTSITSIIPPNQTTTTSLHIPARTETMLLQDHILLTTWLGSWAKKIKRPRVKGYEWLRSADATILPNILRARINAWDAAPRLERSESVARRAYLALKSDAGAKALERLKRRDCAGDEVIESRSQALKQDVIVGKIGSDTTNDTKKQDGVKQEELRGRDDAGNEDLALEDNVHNLDDVEEQVKTEQDGAVRRDGLLSEALGNNVTPQPAQSLPGDTVPEINLTSGSNLEAPKHAEQHQSEPPLEPVAVSKESDRRLDGDGENLSTTEQPSCVGFDSTAHEGEADSPYKDVLSTVTFTESPSFAAWSPCEILDIEHIKLSNLSFRGCEQSGLTLKRTCELEKVAFINCKFDRMTFFRVKMSNVVFSYVDFRDSTLCGLNLQNLTVSRLRFNNDIWCTTYLEKALIGEGSLLLNPGTTRDYGIRAIAASSKTRCFITTCPVSLDAFERVLGRERPFTRHVHPLQSASRNGILTRLASHKSIMNRIMSYCFPGSDVHIYEYPQGVKIPGETRTSKKLYSAKFSTGQGMSSNKTTYFGSSQAEPPVRTHLPTIIPQRGVGNCTGLPLVDKKFSALALRRLYGRSLLLKCSAEGAREFLIAHKDNLKLVKQLVLYFVWPGDGVYFAPNMHGWRYLLGTIRHQFSFIPNINLRVGRTFWKRNSWLLGVKHVLDDVENCPLADAHKFAAPADRWRFKDDQSTHCTDGTLLFIRVAGAKSPEERKFIDDLVDEIKKRRTDRPLFVRSPKGREITYKCAGQFR
jgi:hypothetical protein